ncbi:hypothetical protein R2311_002881 [Cronobacter dublinensis]|nr:hypothetical protein [Cronobacter dublinensis]
MKSKIIMRDKNYLGDYLDGIIIFFQMDGEKYYYEPISSYYVKNSIQKVSYIDIEDKYKPYLDKLNNDIDLERDGGSILYADNILAFKKEPSYSLCKKILKKSGVNIQYLNNPSHELCNIAIKNNGYNLKYVIPFIKQESLNDFYKIAVNSNGMALGQIPNPSYELQLMAVKNCGGALKYITKPTREIALEAARNYADIFSFDNRKKIKKYLDDDFIRESEDIELVPLMMFRQSIQFFKELKVFLVILREYLKAKSLS